MQPVLQLLKCHSAGAPAWCWLGGREMLCPFLHGETVRGHGGGMERPGALPPLLPSRSFLFLSQVFSLSPSLSPFSDFLKTKAFCFYLAFLLYLLSQSPLIWWLWEQLSCFCKLDVAENLLSIEPSMIPAYKAQIYFTRSAEASL